MSSATQKVWEVEGLPLVNAREWRSTLAARLAGGERMVTMFGRKSEGRVAITAVLQDQTRALTATRCLCDAERGYHALTEEFPAVHAFERELHEQHGVHLPGHPWLKPIRFEADERGPRDAYPFYSIDGKEVHEVAVGPIHAGVIEPGAFRFMCLGEQVHHLEIHLGYQHRGVERLLLARDARALGPLVETIAGDTSIAHAWAYAAAIEGLAGAGVDDPTDAGRAVMLELERIAMHLVGLAGLAADVGFLQGASTYGRLRTTAINTSMRLCGSRFGRGAVRPGGSGVRLVDAVEPGARDALSLAELRQNLSLIRTDVALVNELFLSARTVQHRLMDVGRLTRETAIELGLVGMAARACGVELDQRLAGQGVYAQHPVTAVVEPTGDCWARAVVRVREIDRSLAWLDGVLERFPRFAASRSRVGALAPERLAVSIVEGFRGEVVHALETDASGALVHYKVQDPSLRNWLGLAIAVRENEISDFPICNKSFDLSYCGNDL